MKNEEAAIAILAPALVAIQNALDAAKSYPGCDPRLLAVARTEFEKGLLIFASALDGGSMLDA